MTKEESGLPGSNAAGYAAALGSALMVGLFTVINKWTLSAQVPALTIGAWTYFAAGVALLPWALRARGFHCERPMAIALWLLAGSLIGPTFYFLGLHLTSGVQGVLMINLEAVFTAMLAFGIFGEKLDRATLIGGILVLFGGIVISYPESRESGLLAGNTLGNLLIAIGYLGWATENNLGRLLGENIPAVTLVCIKALAAGVMMATLSIGFGHSLAVPVSVIPGIIASGTVSLGLSLALFYIAMQYIGAARTGLIASTSTLWGVLAAVMFLGESLSRILLCGALLMAAGVVELGRAGQGASQE